MLTSAARAKFFFSLYKVLYTLLIVAAGGGCTMPSKFVSVFLFQFASVSGSENCLNLLFSFSFLRFPFSFLHFFNDVQWAKMQISICVMLLFHRHNLFCLNVNYIIMHNHF